MVVIVVQLDLFLSIQSVALKIFIYFILLKFQIKISTTNYL